jgi:alkylhydroperoxidase family enzyme
MTTPRIAPGGVRELGVVNHLISTVAGRVTGGPRPNVFTTLGRQRGLFRAWLWYSGKMMPGGRLPRRETEMVILHIANLRDCEYERRHHVRIGRRVGLTAEQIDHTGEPDWDGWSVREKAILAAVTQLVQERDIDDQVWAGVRAHLDEAETIELLMLCGQYDALATTLMTLRVQPE